MLNDRLLQFVNIDLQEVKVLEKYLTVCLLYSVSKTYAKLKQGLSSIFAFTGLLFLFLDLGFKQGFLEHILLLWKK